MRVLMLAVMAVLVFSSMGCNKYAGWALVGGGTVTSTSFLAIAATQQAKAGDDIKIDWTPTLVGVLTAATFAVVGAIIVGASTTPTTENQEKKAVQEKKKSWEIPLTPEEIEERKEQNSRKQGQI